MYLIFYQDTLTMFQLFFLFFALFTAFVFEFINGFHDTANAVATVIYTHSLKPWKAVVLSGICNFMGVLIGGTAVAFTIVHLLPVEIILDIGSSAGLAMLISLLSAAIIWNFATWFKGIPASSSHTLIGSIIGVGIAHSFITGIPYGTTLTWQKIIEVFVALLTSPILGYIFTFLLVLWMSKIKALKSINQSPKEQKHPKPPPWPIRWPTIISSAAVSFTHGSNDGQKGIGLIMLILIGILPAHYALNQAYKEKDIANTISALDGIYSIIEKSSKSPEIVSPAAENNNPLVQPVSVRPLFNIDMPSLLTQIRSTSTQLHNRSTLKDFTKEQLWSMRKQIIMIDESIKEMLVRNLMPLSMQEKKELNTLRKKLHPSVEYAPLWVIFGVALALGIGTMIGWKRVVKTVGEQIGKMHMTYSQGMSAQIVAAITIFAGNMLGMPVSTTHILSSGVAGGMAANKSGLHSKTVINIMLAWILTLPVSIFLSGSLYMILRLFI